MSIWGLELAGRTMMLNPCSAPSTARACPALAADGQPTDIPVTASYKGANARKYFLSLFPESFTSPSAVSQLGLGSGCRTPTPTAGGPQGLWPQSYWAALLQHWPPLSDPRVVTLLPSGDGWSHTVWGHLFSSCVWGIGGARWFYIEAVCRIMSFLLWDFLGPASGTALMSREDSVMQSCAQLLKCWGETMVTSLP